MDIGCHLPNQGPLATGLALTRFCREAEQRAVASLWVSDHVIFPRSATGSYPGGRFPHPPDKPYLEPVTVLAAAAVCTSRARLGASVFILGHRHPVVMAKMLTSIDALSSGRLICGVGVGWWKEELEILGVPFHARGRHGDEILRGELSAPPLTELFDDSSHHFGPIVLRVDLLHLVMVDVQSPDHRARLADAIVMSCREQPERVAAWLADPREWSQYVVEDGDAELGGTLKELAQTLPWFVEQAFAQALGPIAGQRAADAGRRLLAFPGYASERVSESIARYARDESDLLAHGGELRTLTAQTEELALRVDGLASRVAALSERMSGVRPV